MMAGSRFILPESEGSPEVKTWEYLQLDPTPSHKRLPRQNVKYLVHSAANHNSHSKGSRFLDSAVI
jgi:hypothetical protein